MGISLLDVGFANPAQWLWRGNFIHFFRGAVRPLMHMNVTPVTPFVKLLWHVLGPKVLISQVVGLDRREERAQGRIISDDSSIHCTLCWMC